MTAIDRVTPYAIKGAVFGTISLGIWAGLTHALTIDHGAGLGFLCGVVGGTIVGAGNAILKPQR